MAPTGLPANSQHQLPARCESYLGQPAQSSLQMAESPADIGPRPQILRIAQQSAHRTMRDNKNYCSNSLAWGELLRSKDNQKISLSFSAAQFQTIRLL